MRLNASLSGGLSPLAIAAGLCLLVSPALAQPANDSCSTPMPLTGTGLFPFDNCTATTGSEGQNNFGCSNGPLGPAIFFDLWYCWTANCDGVATVSTCGLTQGDSKIAVYDGCACPVAGIGAIACDDDACSPQAEVSFDVQCGHQYLIQIGSGIDICWQGEFSIECMGTPCDTGPVECDDCCGKAPDFTGFPGAVAVVTQQGLAGGLPSVEVIDISNQGSAPIGAPWIGTPFYSLANNTNWSFTELGSVFGVALDDEGNIYVAHSSVYGSANNGCAPPVLFGDGLGTLSADINNPNGRPGAIYKINTNTGVAAFFAALPNASDPAYVGGQYPANGSESYPGLGNICFDCSSKDLYVSNHEDGRIYRLDKTGAVLSTWKHATGTMASGGAPDANDPGPGFIPTTANPTTGRGQRVWAVGTSGGRLYYSVWRETNCTDDLGGVTSSANEVWSVDLVDSGPNTGEFIPGTEQLEIDMGNYPFFGTGAQGTSNPISDLSFSPDCCMLLGERSMASDTISDAHESRLLEFCYDAALRAWVPSPNVFQAGAAGQPNSCAGGVDYDFDTTNSLVNVWTTADYIQAPPQWVYGILGMPFAGGSPATGIYIDLDQDFISHDKWQQGDLEISCPEPCGELNDIRVSCVGSDTGWTGCYDYTFTFTNNSGVTVEYILITDPNVMQHLIHLPNPVPSMQTSDPVTIRICPDDDTLDCYPLHIALADRFLEECCTIDKCIPLPDCHCLVLNQISLTGPSPDLLNYSLTFTAQNMTGDVIEHMFIVPEPAGSFGISPDYVDLPTLLPNGTTGPIKINMGPLNPGQEYCIRVSIHNQSLAECCSYVYCFETPVAPGGTTCAADLAEPLGQLDFSDVLAFLVAFANQDPRVDNAQPFGQFDFSDVLAYLTLFAEGCP
ncbi:MAG: GC-type dockerin domain-anchored protein [Phycisphaerales bacterium]